MKYEPSHEKNKNLRFRTGPTQTGLYSLRSKLEASNFILKKDRGGTIFVAHIKALISCAVFALLIF